MELRQNLPSESSVQTKIHYQRLSPAKSRSIQRTLTDPYQTASKTEEEGILPKTRQHHPNTKTRHYRKRKLQANIFDKC